MVITNFLAGIQTVNKIYISETIFNHIFDGPSSEKLMVCDVRLIN